MTAVLSSAQETRTNADTAHPFFKYPVIKDYGGIVSLPTAVEQPRKASKMVYDITEANVMHALNAVATQVNEYADAGVKAPDLKLALVFHDQATQAAVARPF